MLVSCECCALSGRGLRRADRSSRGVLPCFLSACDREASIMKRPWPTGGCGAYSVVVFIRLLSACFVSIIAGRILMKSGIGIMPSETPHSRIIKYVTVS